MEEYLVYLDGAPCGSVRLEQQGLYTRFFAMFGARRGRLFSLMLEGERDQVLLGVPEWSDGCYVLRRTLANRDWRGIGPVKGAYLRERAARGEGPEKAAEDGWIRLSHPEYFFRSLTPQLEDCGPCYWKPAEQGRALAVPMDSSRPFLLPRYFCFARVEQLWGRPYAVFHFDGEDCPYVIE